jgi:hypothetical protein
MIIQLNPTIPVWTEFGTGQAIGWLDYSSEHHLFWIVASDSDGSVWTLNNTKIRLQKNISIGRNL